MKVKIQHWRNPNQDLMSLPKFLECIEVFSITSVIDRTNQIILDQQNFKLIED